MTFIELKEELKLLQKKKKNVKMKGFEESFEFVHFKTFFALLDEPKYAILQPKTSEEFHTDENKWFLTYTQNEQMIVIDIADEDTICDEFYQLILIWFSGNRKVTRKKY